MASQAPPPGAAATPAADTPAAADAPTQENKPQTPNRNQGRGGRGGRGRGNQGRGRGRGRGGGDGGRGNGPVSIAPNSGIPYGHVPGYLPGSSSLVEELEKRILIVLRDGRHVVGILRSFDQYSNLVLADSTERKVHRHKDGTVYFSDVPMGVYIVRGDSIVLLGQVAPDDGMKKVEPAELEEMTKGSDHAALEWDFDKDLQA